MGACIQRPTSCSARFGSQLHSFVFETVARFSRLPSSLDYLVKLSQVIKADGSRLGGLQDFRDLGVWMQVVQQAIAQTFVGYGTHLFFDLYHPVLPVCLLGGQCKEDGKQTGEPTHRSGEI